MRVAPHVIMEQMIKLHQFAIMCAPTVSQYAAVEALKNGDRDVERMCESYNERRRFVVYRLREMALNVLNLMEHFMYSRALRNLE